MVSKRLLYIVNLVSPADSQHFVHIPPLLAQLERVGWTVELVSERGGSGTIEAFGRPVRYLSDGSRLKRLFTMVMVLVRYRLRGGRLVFVRISKPAAWVSGLLGRILGWKTVYWLSGAVEDFNAAHGGWRATVDRAALWLMLRVVDRFVTGPETMLRYYARTYRLPPAKLLLLYNDVDLDTVAPSLPKRALAKPRVLMVHRLSPVREHRRYFPGILDVLSTLRREGLLVELHIAGDGPERRELESLVSESGNAGFVYFRGTIPHRDLDEEYKHATLFIMPSYREGFPRVILEAMARGLPIVTTDAGGTRDLLGLLQQRFVFQRNDVQGFSEGVNELLRSPEARKELSQENLAQVRRFSTTAVARMYDEALSDLFPRHRGLRAIR